MRYALIAVGAAAVVESCNRGSNYLMPKDAKLGPGQRFGRWTLVGADPIGKGGNGVVWGASDEENVEGAVKFLHTHHFGSKRHERFACEVAFLSAERGRRGILPLLDSHLPERPAGTERPWLVTPRATPFTLLGLAGPDRLEDLVGRVLAVAKTMTGLHAEGKYHRDLKPENLFDIGGEALVGDFGLVDYPDKAALTESHELVGPLFYMAPEMMGAAADTPGGPADVYALAKTLWVLATGQNYPLLGPQRADTEALCLSTYCPHARSRFLDALIDRATRATPAERPSMDGVARELEAWSKPRAATTRADLSAIRTEYAADFTAQTSMEKQRGQLELAARTAAGRLTGPLAEVATLAEEATGLKAELIKHPEIPPRLRSIQAFGTPRVLATFAQERAISIGDSYRATLRSILMTEALENGNIRAAVCLVSEHWVGGSRVNPDFFQGEEITAPSGSAELESDLASLGQTLHRLLPDAVKAFSERVRSFRGR